MQKQLFFNKFPDAFVFVKANELGCETNVLFKRVEKGCLPHETIHVKEHCTVIQIAHGTSTGMKGCKFWNKKELG